MKKWFWLSVLFPLATFSQVDTIRVQRTKNYFPHIAQHQEGPIPYFLLCDSLGLQTYDASSISSFEIDYWNGFEMEQVHVSGNIIPDSICAKIALYSLGQMIFITKIKSMIPSEQEEVYLNAMHLIPILKEDE